MSTLHPMSTTPAVATLDASTSGVLVSSRVYSAADRDTAYHVWSGPAGKSLRKTSALTGYPLSTIHAWSQTHDWHERSTTMTEQAGRSAAATADRVVQDLITAGQVPAIVALHEIIADPGHKRRDVAALAMLALGGRPLPKAPTFTATKTLGDGTTISVKSSDLQALTPQELAHYARTGELPASVPDPDTEG